MAILSDRDIHRELDDGDLAITPLDRETQIGDSSIDLRLGDTLEVHDRGFATLFGYGMEVEPGERIQFDDQVRLLPGVNYLATTQEKIALPRNICADVKGRSSIGRQFVQVHYAGWVDCEYYGQITLEITNMTCEPVSFPVGQRICQMVLKETKTPPETSYPEKEGQKYAGQTGPTPSRLHMEQD